MKKFIILIDDFYFVNEVTIPNVLYDINFINVLKIPIFLFKVKESVAETLHFFDSVIHFVTSLHLIEIHYALIL